MKARIPSRHVSTATRSLGLAVATILVAPSLRAATLTWDGGGADDNWSNVANWFDGVGDPVLAPATSDTLVFAGASRLTPNNDIAGLVLGNTAANPAIIFATGADPFSLQGNAFIVGINSSNTVLAELNSASSQTISNNITFAGGQRDRNLRFSSGAGSLTLSGNVHFANDIIGLGITASSGVAGTLTLTGTNTGDGKGAQIVAGGNQLRAMLWTPQDGSRLVVGSNAALGNASSGDPTLGTNVLRGIISSRVLYLGTAGADRDLSNYAIGISGARVEYDGANNLSLGTVVNHNGNRDLWVTGSGKLTVTNNIFLSNNDTGRNLFFNVTGSGGAEVTGTIRDSFSNTGGTFVTMLNQGTLRKAGAGTLTLSGDNPYTGLTQIEGGTLRLGHTNALGSTASTDYTSLRAATLDLNGHTTAETIFVDNNAATLINSSGTPAAITTDMRLSAGGLTVGGSGDISLARVWHTVVRTMTKLGTGTLTVAGTGNNNLIAWTINSGTVVLANTSGLASDRGTTINGGTLRLDGPNSNLINDGQAFSMTGGTFDLNGKSEAVASIDGAAGTVTNNGTGLSVLYVGGGVSGTSSGTFAGVIQDGTSALALTKEGTGTQTLTGACTYTGNTTVAAGILSLATAFLDNDSTVTINSAAGAVLNLTHSDTDTVAGLDLGSGPLPAGEYGAVGSGADNEIPEITGTGKLLVFSSSGSPYDTWATGFGGLSNPSADVDFENDGLPSGIEWVVGGNPTAADGPSVAPVLDTSDPSKLIFVFRRTDEADGDFNTAIAVEYGSNLAGWTEAINGVDGVTITVADDFHGAGIDRVTVSIPKTLATSGKMFARLQVEITNP